MFGNAARISACVTNPLERPFWTSPATAASEMTVGFCARVARVADFFTGFFTAFFFGFFFGFGFRTGRWMCLRGFACFLLFFAFDFLFFMWWFDVEDFANG